MSLAELRERLESQKSYYQNYVKAKQEENRIKNEDKVNELIEKAKLISIERDKVRNIKEVERKTKKLNVLLWIITRKFKKKKLRRKSAKSAYLSLSRRSRRRSKRKKWKKMSLRRK